MKYPKITVGGETISKYAHCQLNSTSTIEREMCEITSKRYCELDTLTMGMIYKHWKSFLR